MRNEWYGEGSPGPKCVSVKGVFRVNLGSHGLLSEKEKDAKVWSNLAVCESKRLVPLGDKPHTGVR